MHYMDIVILVRRNHTSKHFPVQSGLEKQILCSELTIKTLDCFSC